MFLRLFASLLPSFSFRVRQKMSAKVPLMQVVSVHGEAPESGGAILTIQAKMPHDLLPNVTRLFADAKLYAGGIEFCKVVDDVRISRICQIK